MRPSYRADIDGLRCIAILPVVFYHAGFELFGRRLLPGGFLGVDVFFVISGYLITGIVMSEMVEGRWSVARFYERRARRILPALFGMMAATIPFALWLMNPAQLQNLGWSALATTLFGANFFLWLDAGYFSEVIELKPLSHMWSLAVEEQFYLLFPLLLWLLFRLERQRHLTAIILIGTALSLGIAQFAGGFDLNANFYLLPTRAWELLGGSLLVTLDRRRSEKPVAAWQATAAAGLGLVMVLASMIFIDGSAHHPGLVTAPVILGTMLILWFGQGSPSVNGLLSWRPVVGIGLISYSLYIWHQPIFSFARLYSINDLSQVDRLALVVASLVVAVISWRFVERPFRDRRSASTAMVWSGAALASVLLLGLSYATIKGAGWPARMPETYRHLAFLERGYWNDKGEDCLKQNCVVGDPVVPTIAVTGDSHAAMLAKSFDRLLAHSGKSAEILADGSVYVSRYPAFYAGLETVLARHKKIIESDDIRTVILSSRAVLRVSNETFDNGEGGVEPTQPQFIGRTAAERAEFGERILEGIEELMRSGKRVVLVYPVPEVGWDVPVTLAKIYARGGGEITTSQARYADRTADIVALYDRVPDNPNLIRIYPEELFCSIATVDRCSVADADSIYYLDDNHLSVAGANRVVQDILNKAEERWGGL